MDRCTECRKIRVQSPKPLIPSTLPELPWQKIGTELFQWKKGHYLLIVDYFSRYIEIAKLVGATAVEIISRTNSIFTRHGIPEVVMSDNGPQFSAEIYSKFASNYQFKHVTSNLDKLRELWVPSNDFWRRGRTPPDITRIPYHSTQHRVETIRIADVSANSHNHTHHQGPA